MSYTPGDGGADRRAGGRAQPPDPPQKDTTHRKKGDPTDAAELDAVDALHPELLLRWIEEAVDRYCPPKLRDAYGEQEAEDREWLREQAEDLEAK